MMAAGGSWWGPRHVPVHRSWGLNLHFPVAPTTARYWLRRAGTQGCDRWVCVVSPAWKRPKLAFTLKLDPTEKPR